MNKLTECDDQGNWCLKGVPWKDLYVGKTITREIQEKLYGALWKLMEYERTGLDPERVEQISESTERMEKALRDLSNGAGMRIEEFVNGAGQLGKSIEEEKNNEKHEMTVIELISLLDQEENKRTASGTERILMLQVNGECFGYLTSAKLNGYGSGLIADVCLEVEAE